jgi:hypothetical protein
MGAAAKLVTCGEPCIRPDHGEWHLWVGQRAATTADGGGAAGGGGEAPAQPWKGVWQGEEARRRAAGGGARWQRISGKKKWRRRHEVLGGGGWRQISGEKQSGAIGGGGCGTADGRQTQWRTEGRRHERVERGDGSRPRGGILTERRQTHDGSCINFLSYFHSF